MSKPSPIQIRYQSGFGNDFATEAERCAARRTQLAVESAAQTLRRTVFGNVFYDAAPFEQTNVDLSYSAVGFASSFSANRERKVYREIRRNQIK